VGKSMDDFHYSPAQNNYDSEDPYGYGKPNQNNLNFDSESEEYKNSISNNDNWLGKTIEGFYIVRLLGKGSFGRVYLAYDKNISDRTVAIKIIRNDEFKEEEVKIQSRLNHSNIVKIFRLFRHTSDNEVYHFVVMEYASEGTLEKFISKKTLPASEALQVIKSICYALKELHKQNKVHRDIKPSNILLFKEGEKYIFKLADFGLVRDDGKATIRAGTSSYMAPEQKQGSNVSSYTDIYALGIILHEILTGELPQNGIPLEKNTILSKTPLLKNVLLKMLKEKPEERYKSLQELLEALERLDRDNKEKAQIKLWEVRLLPDSSREKLKSLNETIRLDKDNGEAYLERALIWFEAKPERSMRDLNRAIELGNLKAYYHRGFWRKKHNDFLGAIDDFKLFFSKYSEDDMRIFAMEQYGLLCLKSHKYSQAIKIFKKIKEEIINSERPKFFILTAMCYERMGNFRKSYKEYFQYSEYYNFDLSENARFCIFDECYSIRNYLLEYSREERQFIKLVFDEQDNQKCNLKLDVKEKIKTVKQKISP